MVVEAAAAAAECNYPREFPATEVAQEAVVAVESLSRRPREAAEPVAAAGEPVEVLELLPPSNAFRGVVAVAVEEVLHS